MNNSLETAQFEHAAYLSLEKNGGRITKQITPNLRKIVTGLPHDNALGIVALVSLAVLGFSIWLFSYLNPPVFNFMVEMLFADEDFATKLLEGVSIIFILIVGWAIFFFITLNVKSDLFPLSDREIETRVNDQLETILKNWHFFDLGTSHLRDGVKPFENNPSYIFFTEYGRSYVLINPWRLEGKYQEHIELDQLCKKLKAKMEIQHPDKQFEEASA